MSAPSAVVDPSVMGAPVDPSRAVMRAAPARTTTVTGDAGQLRLVRTLADLLGRHRRRRGLTQRELADFSTVSIRAIRDIENGATLAPRADTVRLLADTLRLNSAERAEFAQVAGVDPGAGNAPARAPIGPASTARTADRIIGRGLESAVLRDWLDDPDPRRSAVLTVIGLPGVGKTALVRAVADERAGAGLRVVWPQRAGARRDPALRLAEAAVAELLAGPPVRATGPLAGAAGRWVARLGALPTLLVLDDPPAAPHPQVLREMTDAAPGLRVLITTDRDAHCAGERLVLTGLTTERHAAAGPADAWAVLRDPGAATAGTRDTAPAVHLLAGPTARWTPAELVELTEIARLVDGLPALLRAAAPLVDLYGPRTLRDCLAGDPLRTLQSAADRRVADVLARVRQVVADLHAPSGEILRHLAAAPPGTAVTVAELVAATGLDLWDCGPRVDRLRQAGLLERLGAGRFRLPRVIRALAREPIPDRTAPVQTGGTR